MYLPCVVEVVWAARAVEEEERAVWWSPLGRGVRSVWWGPGWRISVIPEVYNNMQLSVY